MANRKLSGDKYVAAVIDTAPSSDGYWTDSVSFINSGVKKDLDKVVVSIRGTGSVVPTLQFRDGNIDSTWTDFYNAGTAFEVGDVYEIETKVIGLEWRVGVKDGGYTSGEITVGLNW